jgi:hypothetical protein
MIRRWLVVSAVVAASAMIYVAPAGASRAANANERQGINSAVYASGVGGINKVPRNRYTVTGQRVSTVSRFWATARLVARPAFRSSFQNASVVEVKLAGTNFWVVVDVGTGEIGCGIAPNRVLADLFRTNTPCPRGGIS